MGTIDLLGLAESGREGLIAFAQKLVQTPSMPGEEGAVAGLMQAEMERLGYDEVWVDEVGNAIGRIAGGGGPALMFNGHMDHVATGDPAQWLHPPFGAEIHHRQLWGRAAADMKGALAAMVHAVGAIKKLGIVPPGDVYVSGVVQEEVGGLGARHLARTWAPAHDADEPENPVRVVIGEASDNHLRRGHRGRVELQVHFEGRSVHASMPDLGVNPHYSLARFVQELRAMDMAAEAAYGISTVAPTLVSSEPESANITPGEVRLVLDWRNVPRESTGEIVGKLEEVLARCLEPDCQGRIEVATKALTTYTGVEMAYPDTFPSFTTAADHPWLMEAQEALVAALGRPVEIGTWRFATDGGHFAEAGATVLGFGPGDARLVHTVEERIGVDQLVESVAGYASLALLA